MLVSHFQLTLPFSALTANSLIEAKHNFCWREGEACFKHKRAAGAVAEALAMPAPIPEPEAEARHIFCYRRGESCYKHKRALDELAVDIEKL